MITIIIYTNAGMYTKETSNSNLDTILIPNQTTKVTQNNTDMCIKESSQQTFIIPNNNLDVRFEQAYQKHNNEQDKPKFMIINF